MPEHAYYEISRWHASMLGINVTVMPGNMIFNRRHWQNGIEILYPVVGTLNVKIENSEYNLSESDLITIDSGLLHEVSSGRPNYVQMIFNIDDKLMRRTEDKQIWMTTVGDRSISRDNSDAVGIRMAINELAEICLPLMESRSNGAGETIISNEAWYSARILINRILLILSKYLVPTEQAARKTTPEFAKLISAIHKNYDKRIDAETLAKELGYGASTIFRLTREFTGMSFRHYLNSVRISMACGMLLQENMSVMDVAYACGFPTSSNFYRVFKLLTGITPMEYRERAGYYSNVYYSGQDEILRYNLYQPMDRLPYSVSDITSIVRQL